MNNFTSLRTPFYKSSEGTPVSHKFQSLINSHQFVYFVARNV